MYIESHLKISSNSLKFQKEERNSWQVLPYRICKESINSSRKNFRFLNYDLNWHSQVSYLYSKTKEYGDKREFQRNGMYREYLPIFQRQ